MENNPLMSALVQGTNLNDVVAKAEDIQSGSGVDWASKFLNHSRIVITLSSSCRTCRATLSRTVRSTATCLTLTGKENFPLDFIRFSTDRPRTATVLRFARRNEERR